MKSTNTNFKQDIVELMQKHILKQGTSFKLQSVEISCDAEQPTQIKMNGVIAYCKVCKEQLDLSEVDIDCDLNSHNPMSFELSIQCLNCHKENEITFDIIQRKEKKYECDEVRR